MAGQGKARQGKARFFHTGVRGMSVIKINKPTDIIERRVRLRGMTDIMFDRYAGNNDTRLEPWQKLYFQPGDSKVIGIPALNIMSFLSAHNTNSAPKRLRDKRKYKDIANACLSFIQINPTLIPLLRDAKPIKFGRLVNDVDELSGCYIHRAVARLDKGIPNPKERPVIPLPWALEFDITLWPTREIQEQEIINLFEEGGRALGLGTFRGVFGKFVVEKWD
jgi:hypothetical protein